VVSASSIKTLHIPLVPDELFDRWQRLYPKPAPLEDDPLHWLRARAYDSSLTKRWPTVIDALERARRRAPLPWADAVRLLNAYGAEGRWRQARALIQELGVSFDAAPELAHVEAIASVHLDDGSRAAELCRTLIDRFADTRNPDRAAMAVRVCLLAPSGVPLPWTRLTDLANRSPLVSGEYLRRSGLVGAVLVGSGKLRPALELLTEASSHEGGFVNPHTLLFAADAARGSGKAREASQWSARLATALSAAGPWRARVMRQPLGAWDVAEIEALRRSRR
jgi:hypothetical protein